MKNTEKYKSKLRKSPYLDGPFPVAKTQWIRIRSGSASADGVRPCARARSSQSREEHPSGCCLETLQLLWRLSAKTKPVHSSLLQGSPRSSPRAGFSPARSFLFLKKLEVSAPLARQSELELRSWAVSWALPRLGAVRLSLRKPLDLWMAQKRHTANTAGAPEEQRHSPL